MKYYKLISFYVLLNILSSVFFASETVGKEKTFVSPTAEKSISSSIEAFNKKQIDAKELLKRFKNAICDGSKSRSNFKHNLVLDIPTEPGLPLDVASERRKEEVKVWLEYLKERFFYETGQRDLPLREKLNNKGAVLFTVPYAEEFDVLKRWFTFIVPKKLAGTIEGISTSHMETWINSTDTQYWGYRGAFKASLALEYRELMWEKLLAYYTQIKTAPQKDGSVKVELTLPMDFLCKYGVPYTDLYSE